MDDAVLRRLRRLTPFAKQVLELLPVETGGIAVAEFAEDLLNTTDMRSRSKILRALSRIDACMGGKGYHRDGVFSALVCTRKRFNEPILYSIPREHEAAVVEVFKETLS